MNRTDVIEDNIIKMPDLNYIPNPNGIGYEIFYAMKKNEDLLAQIIVENGEIDTYDNLFRRCVRTAIELRTRGITSNDIVCICSYNHLNNCVPYLAALFLGAKVCALDPSQSFADVKHLLPQVKPKIIFVVLEKVDMYEELLQALSMDSELVVFGGDGKNSFRRFLRESPEESSFVPEKVGNIQDTAVIMFSSGTTGLAKSICLSHFGLLSQAKNFISFDFNTKISLSFTSLYWISGVLLLIQSILGGTARILGRGFNPRDTWYIIARFKPVLMFMAPSQAIAMLKEGRPNGIDTSSMLCVLTGGGSISPENLLSLRSLVPSADVFQAYGLTEVSGIATVFRPSLKDDLVLLENKPKSCGRPIPGFWYKIVDLETEETLGCNQVGELRLKTKFHLNGYYNMDSTDVWDEEGWLRTGDVCYYDEDHCFYVVDRIKEMLKYQSWHVAPAFIEGILHEHPAVKVAVVIGIPHDEDGDHPMGVVILSEEAKDVTEHTLVEYVNVRVDDRQKLMGGIKFVKDIPYTPTGKIQRKLLKERILGELNK